MSTSLSRLAHVNQGSFQPKGGGSRCCPALTDQVSYGIGREELKDRASPEMSEKFSVQSMFPDGRLPDVDYSKMQMQNLDDLNADRILMEYELIRLQRVTDSSQAVLSLKGEDCRTPGYVSQDVFITKELDPRDFRGISGHFRVGDQLLRINNILVTNLEQANALIRNSEDIMDLLVIRPHTKSPGYNSLSTSSATPTDTGSMIFSDQKIPSNCNEKPPKIQSGPPTLVDYKDEHDGADVDFPHVVYTTPDRLAQTISLQQRLFRVRLEILSQPKCSHDSNREPLDQGVERESVSDRCSKTRIPQSSIENNDRAQLKTTRCSDCEVKGLWIVRRRADGSRYITRRNSRNENRMPRYKSSSSSWLKPLRSVSVENSDKFCQRTAPINLKPSNCVDYAASGGLCNPLRSKSENLRPLTEFCPATRYSSLSREQIQYARTKINRSAAPKMECFGSAQSKSVLDVLKSPKPQFKGKNCASSSEKQQPALRSQRQEGNSKTDATFVKRCSRTDDLVLSVVTM
ncbi:unnamed protein product [Calicophoron daubneyi]|uniref:PDZ domain-containing protein n=1 Tax=Calicophoron daubneyi TaxID=300641 RepID=A0AAV2SY95_CALDB